VHDNDDDDEDEDEDFNGVVQMYIMTLLVFDIYYLINIVNLGV
jgi:hypothetical protein